MSLGVVRRALCALLIIGAVAPTQVAHADTEDYYPPNPRHVHIDLDELALFPLPGLLINGPFSVHVEAGPDLHVGNFLADGSPDAAIPVVMDGSFVGVATFYVQVGRDDGSSSKTYKLLLFRGFPHCDNPVEVCPPEIPDVGIDLTVPTSLAIGFLLLGSALVRIGRRRDLYSIG